MVQVDLVSFQMNAEENVMRVVLALAGLLLLVGCETETPLSREAGNGYWLCSVGDSWNQLTYASPTGFVTRVKLRTSRWSYLEYELAGLTKSVVIRLPQQQQISESCGLRHQRASY